MLFSLLEADEKSFLILKRYCSEFMSGGGVSDAFELDNLIQRDDLRWHLLQNGFDLDNPDEGIRWIKEHGPGFRLYLNSIKLAWAIWYCGGRAWDELTWEEFVTLAGRLNDLQPMLSRIRY